MDRRWSRTASSVSATNASCEALRRPPFRIRLRHQPADDPQGYPTVELSPCPTTVAVSALVRATSRSSSTLLVDAIRSVATRSGRVSREWQGLFHRAALNHSVLIDDTTLRSIARFGERRWTIARIDGPVDSSDATALEQAIVGGITPLDADLRTSAILQVGPHRATWAQFRDLDAARQFVADAINHFVADTLELPVDALPPLTPSLLRVSASHLCIRPRDVRVDGTSVLVPLRVTKRKTITLVADRATGAWGRC